MKSSAMVFRRKFSGFILSALATLLLSGCGHMPAFDWPKFPSNEPSMATTYQPLDAEIAQLAAPAAAPPMMVYCKVGHGTAKFKKTWDDFHDTTFTLAENQRLNVALMSKKHNEKMTFQAIFDRVGQKMVFCPIKDVPDGTAISCASLYALDDDLKMGVKRTFDIPDAVMSAAITCAADRDHMVKL